MMRIPSNGRVMVNSWKTGPRIRAYRSLCGLQGEPRASIHRRRELHVSQFDHSEVRLRFAAAELPRTAGRASAASIETCFAIRTPAAIVPVETHNPVGGRMPLRRPGAWLALLFLA